MTVATTTSKSGPYAGAGTIGPFTVDFRFLENAHLLVVKTTAAGVESNLALGSDYTVAGAGAESGTVTLAVALTSGQTLTIVRNVPATQEADYVQNDAFPAESHERALDKLTMLSQQNAEAIARTLRLPVSVDGVSPVLPAPEANQIIAWNQAANGLQNLNPAALATVVAFGTANADVFVGDGVTAAFTLTANPGAEANLDVALGGATQMPGLDYSWSGGASVTFTTPPPAGVKILLRYFQGLPQGYTDSAASTFIPAGGGSKPRTVQSTLRDRVSVFDFLTEAQIADAQSGSPTLDCTAALAEAQAHAATLPYGATLHFPRCSIRVTALPEIEPNVNWQGEGRIASQIFYSGVGDGLKFAGTINTYTTLRISLRDFTIACSNAGNTGGGLVLESCAYVEVHNVYFEKFKYGHILDQVIHFKCDYSEIAQQTRAGVWIVNGADRRVGANKKWTNNIWYGKEVQINQSASAGIYGIQDDGGVNHSFSGVNFNGSDVLARFAGVAGLTLHNSAFESSLQTPIIFTDTTRESGAYVGPVDGFSVTDNTASSVSAYEILLEAATNGKIEGNGFAGMTSSAIGFGATGGVSNVSIGHNGKLITGTSRSNKPFFASTLTAALRRQVDVSGQGAATYISAALGATGAQTVTPATMENVLNGDYLWVQNEDGSAGEQVLVTATASTTFTAVFAATKAANWVVRGQGLSDTEGTWTPVITGTTTAGAQTHSVQVGNWKRISHNMVHVQATVVITAKDAAMAGAVQIGGLPFKAVNAANRNSVANFAYWSGLTFPANFTTLSGMIQPNDNNIVLRRMGSAQAGAPVSVSELGAAATFVIDAIFYTS